MYTLTGAARRLPGGVGSGPSRPPAGRRSYSDPVYRQDLIRLKKEEDISHLTLAWMDGVIWGGSSIVVQNLMLLQIYKCKYNNNTLFYTVFTDCRNALHGH